MHDVRWTKSERNSTQASNMNMITVHYHHLDDHIKQFPLKLTQYNIRS